MPAETMPFSSEAEAVAYCIERLRPFASTIVAEPNLGGYRPDLGIRLHGMPDVPIGIEVKKFQTTNQIRNLSDGIFQAASYAKRLGTAAFLAPFTACGSMDFHADARVAGAMLVAGQVSVGALAFHPCHEVTKLVMSGQNIVTLGFDDWGRPEVEFHPKARTYLTYKNREGAQSWRTVAS
jgi:hypothetical protein